jgi:hypothetical protein
MAACSDLRPTVSRLTFVHQTFAPRLRPGILAAAAASLAVTAFGGQASAATSAPGWTIDSFATPTHFSPGDNQGCVEHARCDTYEITVTNAGSGSTDGSPVTISDALPPGLSVQRINYYWSGAVRFGLGEGTDLAEGLCTTTPLRCSLPAPVAPDDTLRMVIHVTLEANAPTSLTNAATVSGGGAPAGTTSEQNQIGTTPPAFGATAFSARIAGVDGSQDTRSAGHPYELTTRIDLANVQEMTPNGIPGDTAVQDVKDVVVDLPQGLVGTVRGIPRCTFAQLSAEQCPAEAQVGHIKTEPAGEASVNSRIYNLVPEGGVAAEFGYRDAIRGAHVLYASVAPTPAGYVLRVTSRDVPQVELTNISVTFFGVPTQKDGSGNAPVPMFTNPASCSSEPLVTSLHMDSWQNPARYNADGTPDFTDPRWVSGTSTSPPVTACNQLQFTPAITARPETSVADSPTGLDFGLEVPQTEAQEVPGSPPLRNATVQLPPRLTVDPSSAHGLAACSPAQIGWLGDTATDFTASRPACPEASRIGTVEVTTPLLPGPLSGSIYLATQNENPFHAMLAAYIVIDDPVTGVVLKIPGSFTLDPNTGQITGHFDDNPQLPFSQLKLQFKGGTTGVLATPETCGVFTTTATLTPWSAPDSGPPATPSDSFPVSSGCVIGFVPRFKALMNNPVAGAYSPFTLSLSRSDTDQELSGLSVSLPPGLLADIARVPVCPDAALVQAERNSGAQEASNPSCSSESQVGTVKVGVGPGPNPFFVSGKVYLTGPYRGAPYGLAVVVPALAGPFDLGTVVVRQTIEIDPHDAHVTVRSDPFPTIRDGIVLRLRRIDAAIDRPGFTFNPTDCGPMAIAGTLTSADGLAAAVSSRFQVGECQSLSFKPTFTVFTRASTSKANGAYLNVKVMSGPGQANIAKVKVDLPKQLPSRLSTLQKACLAAVFDANPASCPAGSVVGTATAVTPVLKNALTGPAYLVSHGGAQFPDLEIVLQGEGITLILDGQTDIKHGVTISSFSSVPDAPITKFDLVLPQGPHSALGAVANLCSGALRMPTSITGQNGAVLKQTTKIAVAGCPKHKKGKRARRSARHVRGKTKRK